MTRHSNCLAITMFLLTVGCGAEGLDDEEIGSLTEDLSQSELEAQGYTCETVSVGWKFCKKCHTVQVQEGNTTVTKSECTGYDCMDGGCESTGTYYETPGSNAALHFWFEAEQGTLTAPMQKQTDYNASAGQCALVPTSAGSGGSIAFQFTMPTAGVVFPWARVSAPSTASNSLSIRIDGGPLLLWDTPVTGSAWSWSRVQQSSTSTRTSFALGAGNHTLRIYRAEAGTRIDRVLLNGDPAFVPVADTYQAENAAVVAPMQRVTPIGPSAVGYAWVPTSSTGSNGLLRLDTPVPAPGRYAVWARVNAPSSAHNSFRVSASFQPGAIWDTPVTSATGWAWGKVRARGATEPLKLDLSATYPFVDFGQAETGTKLDRFIVTNDPGFLPVDPASVVVALP